MFDKPTLIHAIKQALIKLMLTYERTITVCILHITQVTEKALEPVEPLFKFLY